MEDRRRKNDAASSVVREMLFRSINLPLTLNLGIADFIFLFEGYLGPVEPRPLARTQQHGPRGHVCMDSSIPLKIWRTTLTDSVYGLKMKFSWDIFYGKSSHYIFQTTRRRLTRKSRRFIDALNVLYRAIELKTHLNSKSFSYRAKATEKERFS